jgi:hypothetical protein
MKAATIPLKQKSRYGEQFVDASGMASARASEAIRTCTSSLAIQSVRSAN